MKFATPEDDARESEFALLPAGERTAVYLVAAWWFWQLEGSAPVARAFLHRALAEAERATPS